MRSERGVSEVIGTILVLGITVVLFASILVWVTSMPTPPATIRADMDGELTPILDEGGGWAGARLSARHRGGETLLSWRTNLFVTVERESGFETETLDTRGSVAGVSYGIDGADRDWNAGETWSYTNRSVLESDRITLSVVDREASVIVWSEELHGPSGAHPPVFLEKWLDGDASTQTTRDTPRTGLPFGLYARVEDRDGDLNRADVRATFTFGPRATVRLYDDGTHGDHVANDGVFTRYDEADNMLPEPNWDGGIVILRAEDLRGRGTESRVTFAVIRNPDEEGGNGSSSLGPLDLFHRNEFQTFAIYNATEWDKKRWAANETRTFKKGEVVVVIVASQYLRNLDILNRFVLYNADGVPPVPVVYGEAPYNQPVGANTKPSSTHAFAFLQEVSDFYIFEHRFGTNSTAYGYDGVQPKYGRYPLEIGLRANIVPPPRNQFNTVDAITVTDANGAAPDFPAVEFFKDAAHTQSSIEFAFTDTVYVRVRVNTTDAGVSAGDVTISDYVDGVQIWRRPGTPPVGPITVDDVRHYAFAVDLSNPNPDPWVPNRNAYGFQIKELSDRDENYALSAQIVVRGARWSLDIASAIQEYSHPVFGTKWYSVFNDNDRLWSEYLIESYQPSPSQQDPPWGGGPFFQSVFSDLDEDGDLDVAVGNQAGYVWWYRNTGGRGRTWEKFTVDVPASPVGEGRAVAAGRIDRDADNDLVVGTHNGKIYWYANDGLWTRTTIASLGANIAVKAIKVADADMDGDKDVVVGTQNSQVRIYRNGGNGTFPAPQVINLAAEAYDLSIADVDNDTDNDIVVATGTNVRIYEGPAFVSFTSLSATNAALSVDVGYFDGDGLLDVVAGTSAGKVHWWRNGPWIRSDILVMAGADAMFTLRAGDVDGDLIDDVVVGTATGWVKWMRHLPTGAWSQSDVLIVTPPTTTTIYDIDIGDVDRGVIIDLSK
ncbi:MAG TPA: FG-GAP-like repeat-containing protein [Thermoplasmata archaeon]|nr:FG-GAP-like repeat-containing protein [Thermoplasmata archaeon]